MTNEKSAVPVENKRKFSIQISMLISFLLVLMVACGSIIYYDYIRITQAFLAHVEDQIRDSTESVVGSTVSYLEPAKLMTQLSAGVVDKEKSILENSVKITDLAIQSLIIFPQISGFYHGDRHGDFISISRSTPGATFPYNVKNKIPEQVAYSIHIISRRLGSIPSEYYLFKDKNGVTLAVDQRPVSSDYYDPRVRPWYTIAEKAKQPIWSEPYVFASTNQVGITAAIPVIDKDDVVKMVLSADITMREISKLLAQKKVGETGVAFIFNDQGQVIGYPDIGKIFKKSETGRAVLPTIADTENSAVIAAFKTFKSTGHKSFIQDDKGIEYIVRIIDISKELGSQGYIGFMAPKYEFTAEADKMTRTMVVFSVIIFIFSAVMIYLISRNISTPIQRTAQELVKIGNFDIEVSTPIESHFHEIAVMNRALAATKRSLRDFGRFVPKAMVRKLIESGEGAELGGKKMNITVMFTDVEGFTAISEKMSSEKLALHISDYFDQLTQIIIEEQGTIDKYIGDSIMALWGAPLDDPNHPTNACRAVLNCIRRLADLNKNWALEGKPVMRTRFGIHTGDAVVGNVGSKDRLNYSAFGDSVNLASRLESANKYYHTYAMISHDTYKEVRTDFICRPIDIIAVVGKAEGVRIYELMLERSNEPRNKFEQDQADTLANMTTIAFELYLERNFKKAESAYQDILRIAPDDQLALYFIQRCKEYQKSPPPKNWRGVYVMTHK
jgi:adenylate cyclase